MINLYIYSFFIYFFTLIAIGLHFYRRNRSEQSFLLANRSLNYWVTAISAQSSDMGSWLFLAYPAVVFTNGLIEIWTAVGLVCFMYLNWKIVASRLRADTEKYNAVTLSTYLQHKFNDASGTLVTVSALISIFFFLCYLASGLVGLGRLFEAVFDINYFSGVILGTLVTVAYILLGGFFAVAWCNLFQGLFLLAMIIFVPLVAVYHTGNISGILQFLQLKGHLGILPSGQGIVKIVSLILGFGLGYFGQPHILINFMSIDDKNHIKKATLVGITWQILVLCAAISIGLIGVLFFKEGIANPEHIFVVMVKSLFNPLIGGFALCAILAASLSTINTQLLVAAGNFAQDLYPKIINKQCSEKTIIFVSRCATIVIALVAMVISYTNSSSIYDLVLYAWSGLGASFGPAILHALYAKNLTRNGVIIGMITGALCAASWPLLQTNIPALIPAFIANYAVICLTRIASK